MGIQLVLVQVKYAVDFERLGIGKDGILQVHR